MSDAITFPLLVQLQAMSGKGAKFASFTYTNVEGETAIHTLILGVNMRNLYEKDIATVNDMIPTLTGLELEAAQVILSSLAVSLSGGIGNNPAYAHGADMRGEGNETYFYVDGLDGVKVHRETGDVYVNGISERKVVLVEGTYKVVNSKPLTLAKKAIDKGLRRSKIRQFKLSSVTSARLNGETLEFI